MTTMARFFIIMGAILTAIAVAIGAFGAHGLEAILVANGREGTFDTASQYHLAHAIGLIIIGILGQHLPMQTRLLQWAGIALIVGIIFFSGSLYVLAIFDLGIMGAIAPIGGTAFIVGWSLVGWGAYRATG